YLIASGEIVCGANVVKRCIIRPPTGASKRTLILICGETTSTSPMRLVSSALDACSATTSHHIGRDEHARPWRKTDGDEAERKRPCHHKSQRGLFSIRRVYCLAR